MFQRSTELLQLEAFPGSSQRPLATLLRLISHATSVGFWSPTPAGVLKLVAWWGEVRENRESLASELSPPQPGPGQYQVLRGRATVTSQAISLT